MRRRLVLVFLAISSLVALAFVVPLAFLVQRTAEDRAIDAARADAGAVVPSLVAGSGRAQVEAAVGVTASGEQGRMTVVTSTGWTIGLPDVESDRLDAALRSGESAIGDVNGGVEVVIAVATGPDELSAVRVFVPRGDLQRGQTQAWAALALVAIALIGISVLVADLLARSVVRPTQQLASAARRLGDGELETRVEPAGPSELVELSRAFNELGSRVSSMLVRERELVADLSHRLRTPLTRLRLRLDQVDDETLAGELRSDLNEVTLAVNAVIREARAVTFDPEDQCDAAIVVAKRAAFWSALAEDQNRLWHFTEACEALMVGASSAALGASVDVLIENVMRHTDDGTPVTVGVKRDDGVVRIWVADGGPGFEDAHLERGVSGVDSTGLGLDIARRTATSANGNLHVSVSEWGGAEVALVLPLVDGKPE